MTVNLYESYIFRRSYYEGSLKETGSIARAQQAVYERTRWVIQDFLGIAGIHDKVAG
jgi:hypothetical protein